MLQRSQCHGLISLCLHFQLTREVIVMSKPEQPREESSQIYHYIRRGPIDTKGLPCFQSETNTQYHQRSLHLDSRPKIVPGAIVIVYTYDGPSLCTCQRLIQIEVMITVTLILRLLFFTQLLKFFRINLSNVIIVYFFIFSQYCNTFQEKHKHCLLYSKLC